MAFSNLAQELIDIIVDHACTTYECKPENLSLVCRSLHERAQEYLFKVVNLKPRGRYRLLLDIITANPRIATYIHHIHTTVHQLVEYRGPDMPVTILLGYIRTHVPHRTLKLTIYENPTDEIEYPVMPTRLCDWKDVTVSLSRVIDLRICVVGALPASFLSHFRSGTIERLELCDVTFTPKLPKLRPIAVYNIFGMACRSVKYLKIKDMDLLGFIIVFCPNLQSLIINHPLRLLCMKSDQLPRPRIKTLATNNCTYLHVNRLVTQLVDLGRLECFFDGEDVGPQAEADEGDLRCIPYILNACKMTLKHLRLRGVLRRPADHIDISQLKNLSHLTFIGHCVADGNNSGIVQQLLNILQSIPPRTHKIELIEIRFYIVIKELFDLPAPESGTDTDTEPGGEIGPQSEAGTDKIGVETYEEFTRIPPFFQCVEWADIKTLFVNIGRKTMIQIHCGAYGRAQDGWYSVTPPADFDDIVKLWVANNVLPH